MSLSNEQNLGSVAVEKIQKLLIENLTRKALISTFEEEISILFITKINNDKKLLLRFYHLQYVLPKRM